MRILSTCAVAAAAALVALAAPPAGAAPSSRPEVQLVRDEVARAAPTLNARRVATVSARRPLTGVATVLPELGRSSRVGEPGWVQVALPGRPNGATGWIRAARTRAGSTPWHLTVDLSRRQLTVTHSGRVLRRFRTIVGARSTPTPRGRFFVEEAVALRPGTAGGPFALATSARSNVLQEFNGGPGQIALHGRHFLPEPLGSAASHGCVRLSTEAITWLAKRIGAGVPVDIVA